MGAFLLEFLSETGIILSVIFVLLTLIYFLILFILIIRLLERVRNKRESNFIARWEEKIFEYLASDIAPSEVLNLFPKTSYKYLLQNLRNYLLTLKGRDREKLTKLINETELFDYLIKKLKSSSKKRVIFGAYYLGLARSENAEFVLHKKLKSKDEMVFVTSALSLARINSIEMLDEIFEAASKFKSITEDTMLSILYEFDEVICEALLKRLNHESSSEFKSLIISTLTHFKSADAAPIILKTLLNETNSEVIIKALEYFGKIKYLDASTSIRFLLINPNPEIKAAAIKAASMVGHKSLEDRIWSLIYDKNRYVKVTAAEVMYSFSENSRKKLEQLAYSIPNTIESSIARMVISEKTIYQN